MIETFTQQTFGTHFGRSSKVLMALGAEHINSALNVYVNE